MCENKKYAVGGGIEYQVVKHYVEVNVNTKQAGRRLELRGVDFSRKLLYMCVKGK